MKLALITETFPPEVNGVAMTFGVLARELSDRGHAVTVVRPRRKDLPRPTDKPEFHEIEVLGVPIPGYASLRFGLPAYGRLRRAWRAERPDLVHVATEGPLGASAITVARGLGIPVTSSFHTNFHSYTGAYGYPLLRRLVVAWLRRVHNRTAKTFAPTTEMCADLSAMGFRDLALLSRGVDTWQFHPARRAPELRAKWGVGMDDPVVIHVGRMAAEKNYGLLFETYAAMRAANPRLRFVIAGEGPLKAQLMREHPECIFVGFFSRQEIGRYYASADIYIHASETETFGNVVTEALASGLAVASFDYAAARQFIRHGESGLTVPLGDRSGFHDIAVMLATDEMLRTQVRCRARASVEGQSWSVVASRFEDDLLAVAGGGKPFAKPLLA